MKVEDLTQPLHEVGYGRGGGRGSTWSGPVGYGRGQRSMAGQAHADRIQQGKKMEADIARRLQELGIKVEQSGRERDVREGIDFFITIKGQRFSAQAKQREVGDDIIFEVYKFWEGPRTPPNGRDFKGRADLYIAVDTKGNGYVVETKNLKQVAKEYVEQFGFESGNYKGASFKTTKDRRSGDDKLMAFFPPSKYGRPIPGFKK